MPLGTGRFLADLLDLNLTNPRVESMAMLMTIRVIQCSPLFRPEAGKFPH